MSNKTQTPFDNINWSDIQKKYMDALMSFQSPNSFNQPSKPSMDSFWVQAMNDWWKSVKPETPLENENLFEKVLEQSRNYYFMSEQFSNMVDGIANLKNKNKDITSFITKKFKEMETAFSTTQNNFSWANIMDTSEEPFDLMKNAFPNMPFNSGGMFNDINPDVKKIREQFLSVPGLGYSREAQDKYQELIKLWAEYQDNHQEYKTVMAQMNHEALELMRNRILAMTKDNENISSMRQVYDLWVESNEKIYGEYVFTKDHSELNGRLVNSLMAFKKKNHEITEDLLSAMNMPTTKAVNELERRHYELRKQIRTMQFEIKNLQKQLLEKNNEPASEIKEAKTVTRTKKKAKRRSAPVSAKTVEVKQAKKKNTKSAKPVKKKTKQKKKSASADKGMIELKF